MKIEIGKSQKTLAKEARKQRIKERKASTKANPSNKEIFAYLNDLHEEIAELKQLINP